MTAKRILLLRALTVTSALSIALLPRIASAQAAPADQTTTTTTTTTATTTAAGSDEEAVVLSPFVVDAAEEKGSYKANSTLAGTRVRTDLNDVASALSVVTAQFLQDTGATNNQDLLVYTPNTEVAGLNGNFSGQAGNATYNENTLTPNTTTRVRGLSAADNTRDYFLTDIPWDSFNVGRVDLQRGPNSILFGVGSPGGIINNDINDAEFTNANHVEDRFDEYGSLRNSADFNYVLIPNELAIRISWVNDEAKFEQHSAFDDQTRYYGALRYDPVIFGKDNHTSIRAKFEKGTVTSNNPRALPPTDELTPWFAFGKPTVNQWATGNDSSSSLTRIPAFGGNGPTWAEGRSYWPDVLSYYNGTQGQGVNSNTPTWVESAMINDTTALHPLAGPANHTIGDFPYYRLSGIPDYSFYATNVGVPGGGGSYYSDKVLTDPSIFNFYKKLLDGPIKKEWQRWTALNASLSQTFLDDRLGFELVYDTQHYNNGQVSPSSNAITVDVNQTYVDGTPNPNFGRPMVANSDAYGNYWGTTDRNSLRLTGTAELRFSDFMNKDSWAAQILGRHVITGLLEEDTKSSENVNWSQYATDLNWEVTNNVALTTSLQSNRQFDWVDYIGPNMLGNSSASGMNLNGITSLIAPSPVETVRNFNATWNAPASVDSTAPFTYPNHSVVGTMVVGTQADNPANYVGWQNQQVNWLSANNPADFPDLVTGANKAHFADISQGFTWQGYMFDGTVVPTFGWRKDEVVNYATAAPQDPQSVFYSTDFSEDPRSRQQANGETKAWGGVYHFPRSLTKWLPWGTTFSVFYDHNANFEAQAPRTSLAGAPLPNPTGKTKEKGFTISTLNDKLTLKVDWYNTLIQNSTFDSSNDGGTGYQLWAVPSWGYEYATDLQVGMAGNGSANNPIGNYLWNYGWSDQSNGNAAISAGHTGNTSQTENVNDPDWALQNSIVQAWLHIPLTSQFYNAYGIHTQGSTINPEAALASGQLISAFAPGWNANSGGGSQPGPLNPVTTVDTLSKGEEFELSAQPIRNWNITANYSRTFATHSNIDALTQGFMKTMTDFFNGPGGQLRLWGDGAGNQIVNTWIPNVYNEYLVEVNSQGTSSPEVSPWRFNLITTYSFDRGKLKGYFIGGAGRLEAGRILGYQYSAALGTLDISKPWIGPNDEHYDLWFGYSRRIFANKINWRIQANIRNLFEKDRLIASQLEPDGSLALARIQEGMTWQLTNAFDF